ncbi:hypothetical protein [Arthrobacter sedimenti]|uniref:hypothetical protein n=1 Tax=Arthrobacter sedimenti TaxID=2694931 RepID=UPI001124118D|nr:hypothetical protein [Arthrobacter sedimenti]
MSFESGACVVLTLNLAATTTPSGDPTLRPGLDPSSVTPGTLGFLATLFVVVVVIFLIRDMTKRIRRVRYTAEVQEARVQRGATDSGPVPPAGAGDGGQRRPQGPDGNDLPMPGGKHGPDNR